MRRYGIFTNLYFLCFSMFYCFIDGDDGAGGGSDNGDDDFSGDDIGDFDLDDEASGSGDNISVSKADWDRVNSTVDEIERQNAFSSTVESIKSDIPDFNEKAVVAELQKMHKSNPEKANSYNNEAGFKAIFYELQQKAAKNDDVNGGGNKGGGESNFTSALDGAMQGKTGSLRQAISMAL